MAEKELAKIVRRLNSEAIMEFEQEETHPGVFDEFFENSTIDDHKLNEPDSFMCIEDKDLGPYFAFRNNTYLNGAVFMFNQEEKENFFNQYEGLEEELDYVEKTQ